MDKRIFGLDVLRSFAIIMVLLSHSRIFFSASIDLQYLGLFGYYGVELFFVLSGFLIGGVLLRNINSKSSWLEILNFYIYRWMRTLPSYYLVLLIYIFVDIMNSGTYDFHLYHFVFLQNFFLSELNFFGVSWSLAIEEWFYLIIPWFILFIPSKGKKIHGGGGCCF